jgi:hypothetical protein
MKGIELSTGSSAQAVAREPLFPFLGQRKPSVTPTSDKDKENQATIDVLTSTKVNEITPPGQEIKSVDGLPTNCFAVVCLSSDQTIESQFRKLNRRKCAA